MELVKAEILWTRKCPLRCSFCAMQREDIIKAPVEKMIQGLDRLKELECQFIAIYGASPIFDFEGLPEYINHAVQLGILPTIITDGVAPNHKEKLSLLYDNGLRSLTVSYDFVSYDHWSHKKSEQALPLVHWFSQFADIRDIEVIATITMRNYQNIIQRVTEDDLFDSVWFSFDFVHPDRGQPGSKCHGGADLSLSDSKHVIEFATAMLNAKQRGKLIHQSDEVLQHLIENPQDVTKFQWNCSRSTAFPAWLTIDSDGSVLPCDDFWTDRTWKIWDLDAASLLEFSNFYRAVIEARCPGCFWTTHWDACRIKEKEGEGFNVYIHK